MLKRSAAFSFALFSVSVAAVASGLWAWFYVQILEIVGIAFIAVMLATARQRNQFTTRMLLAVTLGSALVAGGLTLPCFTYVDSIALCMECSIEERGANATHARCELIEKRSGRLAAVGIVNKKGTVVLTSTIRSTVYQSVLHLRHRPHLDEYELVVAREGFSPVRVNLAEAVVEYEPVMEE